MATTLQQITRAPVFRRQILPNSEAICEISQNFAALLSPNTYIPWPVGVVVLTNNTSKYKDFILTCNTKTQAINDENIRINDTNIIHARHVVFIAYHNAHNHHILFCKWQKNKMNPKKP